MKYTCLSCLNEDTQKFTATRKGFICLVCFEKSVNRTPENQAEIAMVDIDNHLSRGTGGNNRKFTKAYSAMRNKLTFLDSLPDKTEAQNHFASGFREALKTFEVESR